MKLIKLTDYNGVDHFLNKRHIISVRPTNPSPTDNGKRSKVEYGTGFVDYIWMKESAIEVAKQIDIWLHRLSGETNDKI